MTKEEQAVAEYAHRILHSYFCDCDVEFLISGFAPDIVWLGGGEAQKAEGAEAVAAAFRAGKDGMIPCRMWDEQYEVRRVGPGCWLCEGVSMLESVPGLGMYVKEQQRCTFVFRETAEGLKSVHIHNSIPYQGIDPDELFPIRTAKETYEEQRRTWDVQLQNSVREVRRQADFLTQLYNTLPCGVIQFSTDECYRLINANRMAWEIYGYTEEEYFRAAASPVDLVLEEDRARILKTLSEVELGGSAVSYTRESRHKDGTPLWINAIMERLINADGLEVIQAVFTDISEIHRLQEEREQERVLENQYLRAAIYRAYPLIMNVNLTQNHFECFVRGDFVLAQTPTGTLDEMLEQAKSQVDPVYLQEFAEMFSKKETLEHFAQGEGERFLELRVKGLDGSYHWISIHAIQVDNPYGDDTLAVVLVKVLDEQRAEKVRQEQLLRDALAAARAASTAKSDFLSRMIHDIRTPMNAIIGMSTIGQMKLAEPQRVKDCFEKIDASSRYLLSLINDILDMSKIEQGKMTIARTEFDFGAFMAELAAIIGPQAEERGLDFDIYHQEPLQKHYIGDALRLNQILMNLLSNALKFTHKGGKVTLSVRENGRTNGFSYLEFKISDNGIGISPEFRQKLFQPFEQETPDKARNNIGSGLGLSIVYNLVQLMGGTIEVDSERGKGTSFTVSLPVELVDDDDVTERERKAAQLMKGVQVLVADDDSIVGEQTAAILGEIGAVTLWVDSGAKAVEAVRAAKEAGQHFDIAMVDWRMPDMDGVETTRRIRTMVGRDTTIIIISAYDWSEIEEEARAAGADSFIAKPLFRSEMYDAVTRFSPHADTKAEDRSERRFAGKRVLLVEDNLLNMEIAKTLLEFHGIAVDAVENGLLALEAFRKAEPGRYFAVLMDIRMPVMDGLAATRAIRALERSDAAGVPIIAMTANAFLEDRKQAAEAGMSGYLIKPIDVDTLLQELEKYE